MPFCEVRTQESDGRHLRLAEVGEHGVDELEGLIDLLADFRAREHDLAGDEDEQDDLRLHHPVDQAGEEFGLVRAEHVMPAR